MMLSAQLVFFLSAKLQAESYNLNIVKYFYAEQL